MDKGSTGIGVHEKLANTSAKWSPHVPNMIALGSAENFGVVGKGITQIKKIEGNQLIPVSILEEKVICC